MAWIWILVCGVCLLVFSCRWSVFLFSVTWCKTSFGEVKQQFQRLRRNYFPEHGGGILAAFGHTIDRSFSSMGTG